MTRVEGLGLPSGVQDGREHCWTLLWACSNIVGLQRLVAQCVRAADLHEEGLREALCGVVRGCPGLCEVHLGEETDINCRPLAEPRQPRNHALSRAGARSVAKFLADTGAACGGCGL
jgi:hypothetical protein